MSNSKENIAIYQNQLKDFLLTIAPETLLEELIELVSMFKLDMYPKNQKILEAGETSENVYFIYKGLVRIFYLKGDKEVTNWLVKENMVFSGIYSVLLGEKNNSFYEAIEDTYVLKISKYDLESLYKKYHSLEHLGRRTVEIYYGAFMKKTYSVLFLSADERYKIFLKEHGDLLNRISLRVVATYLGITQETLSRLRTKR